MQSPQDFSGRPTVENQILLASGLQNSSGIGDAVVLDGLEVLLFQLDVAAVNSDDDDTLDVYVQTLVDGTNWLDAVHFAQVLGGSGAKRYVSKISVSLALTEYRDGDALAASAVRHVFGSRWRARWDIFSGNAASFIFGVRANGT